MKIRRSQMECVTHIIRGSERGAVQNFLSVSRNIVLKLIARDYILAMDSVGIIIWPQEEKLIFARWQNVFLKVLNPEMGCVKNIILVFLYMEMLIYPFTHKKPKSSCSVEDCDDFAKVKGWCIYHYRRCYPPEIARLKKERNLRRDQRNKEWRERRAKKLSVPHEPYTAEIILQVHGTRCHLCGDEINLDAPRRSDMVGWEKGLHLDHVTPLAKGGSDLIINVKPAHGICNLRKGTKILNAQLG